MPFFFERYPAPVDVYFLEKTGIRKGDTGESCTAPNNEAGYLERRVSDNLAFIDRLPALQALGPRSLRGGGAGGIAQQASAKEFFGHPCRYWSSHLFYDPLVTYRQLDIPIIAAMGEKDDSEPIEAGSALRDDFARHPEKDFTFIEYPNGGAGQGTSARVHRRPGTVA